MNLVTRTLALSAIAVLLVASTAAANAEPWKGFASSDETGDPLTDESGFPIFGFNIAFAGNTPAAVKHFVAGLNATQKHSVEIGCNEVLRDPALAGNTTVFDFCRNYRS